MEVKRILRNVSIQSVTFDAYDYLFLWHMSQKHVVLDVIGVSRGYRIFFDLYSSDGVFTTRFFPGFWHVPFVSPESTITLWKQTQIVNFNLIAIRISHQVKYFSTSSQFDLKFYLFQWIFFWQNHFSNSWTALLSPLLSFVFLFWCPLYIFVPHGSSQ